MANHGIKLNPKHAGMLHADLGIAAKNHIPVSALMRAKRSEDPAVRKRANFVINARGWHHGGKK